MSEEENVKISIRVSSELKEKLNILAQKNSCTISELIRASLEKDFEKHVNSIEYIDIEQGKKIRELLFTIKNEISDVKTAMNRIGNNLNQAVRLKYVQNNYNNHTLSHSELFREIEDIRLDCSDFSEETLNQIIYRYDNAANHFIEGLKQCHILE